MSSLAGLYKNFILNRETGPILVFFLMTVGFRQNILRSVPEIGVNTM